MIGQFKNSWQCFKRSEPGSRFQDRYHRRSNNSKLSRSITPVVGIVMVLVGLASMPFPIPADGFLVPLGLIVIANEVEPVARFLDWAEVQARKAVGWAMEFWSKSSRAVRFLIVVALVVVAAALCYGTYYLVFGS